MQEIIPAISRETILEELNADRFIRKTRKGDNEIYIVNNENSPNILQEIGRLREITFRDSGGGTGESLDLDDFDTGPFAYEQLIVWSPEDQEIIGGYRFVYCKNNIISTDNQIHLSTAHYFDFTQKFLTDYLPFTIELGRSWVQPMFQPSQNARKGLFALDNIWDGLGSLTILYPEVKYFFGKVTMYPSYNSEARDMLLNFMHYYFPDNDKLMSTKSPLVYNQNDKNFEEEYKDLDFKEGFKKLNTFVRSKNEGIPPLVNIYMSLSPTMKTFGTAINEEFGNVEETGILVTIEDIYLDKKERHIVQHNEENDNISEI